MDSIIALLVILAPLFFYSYLCFPATKVWETYFFTYISKYYENVETFMWVFLQKFVFLYLMIIWYITSQNWWNKAILLTVAMLLYQIMILLNDDIKIKDGQLDKFVIIPLSIAFCILLIYIKNKLAFYTKALDLKDQIARDIELLKSQNKNAKRD